ncbi:MAG: M15 family metallopeptidase [Promicromonosporaceae bacterium]|nr:M15 family metallopeptidase [Promicromonosporaceae bacterium]
MIASQNGWPVLTTAPAGRLAWITGRVLPGPVAAVFDYLARRIDAEVEHIDPATSWGWNDRNIRGSSTTRSNHASGTAVDFNAPRHPRGARGTFTPAQAATIRAIVRSLDGVVRWGGDYTVGPVDEMHYELVGTPAQVAALAARLTSPPAPTPAPAHHQQEAPVIIRRASDGASFYVSGGVGARILNGTDLAAYSGAGVETVNLSDAGYAEAQGRFLK